MPSHRGWRLAALSVGQVLSWGVLYYALIIASPVIAADTGWPLPSVTLAFSSGLVLSAIAGVWVGRWLGDFGPRRIMTAGSVLGPVGLLVVSVAPNIVVFGAGWLIVGLAQSAVLYQAAFTVIARRYGMNSRGPMTILTLAGGLASTVFAPVVAGSLLIMDWRSMYQVFGLLLVVTTVPLHWFSLERSWEARASAPTPPATVGTVLRTRRFWALQVSMIFLVGAVFSVTLALVPLFMEKGFTFEAAAWAIGLLGAGQVIGRLIYLVVPRTVSPWVPLAMTAALSAVLLLLLGLVPGPMWVLVVLGVLAGAVRGAQTLVQASAVLERWGSTNYGAINGFFAAPLTVLVALAPSIGPLLAEATGSYGAMAVLAACFAAAAAVTARWS